MDSNALFNSFADCKVGVLGDVMLDTYWWGHVERISPEAPVPIVAFDKKEYRIGGAGNVALNLAALGAQTSIISVIGKDDDGALLQNLFLDNKVSTTYLLADADRITTNKTRIMSRSQQMLRLDMEITHNLAAAQESLLIERIHQYILTEKPQVLIFEDYNKGVLTPNVIQSVIALCQQHHVITTVDPKQKNFFAYQGIDIFKPNLKEVKEGLNISLDTINDSTLTEIHALLKKQLHHRISFITLSEKGVFYSDDSTHQLIPSHIRNIADVSGAGDTVIAVASLVYAVTQNMSLAAAIANIAGGLVCEIVGTAPINKTLLLEECIRLL